MGVLPLEFVNGENRKSLGLTGLETVTISRMDDSATIEPRETMRLSIQREDGSTEVTELRSRIDTENEIEYFKCGGILQFVLNDLIEKAA